MENRIQPSELSQESLQVPIHIIQMGKNQRPFIMFHGDWTGGPFYCYTLARSLGREYPFYALDPYNFNGPQKPLTFEEMATAHLQALKVLQPEGPYLLGGYCNGALVACEVARQLQVQGEEVKLLVLITPSTLSSVPKTVHTMLRIFGPLVGLTSTRQRDVFIRMRHALRHLYRKLLPPNNKHLIGFSQLLKLEPQLETIFPPLEALYNDYVGVFTWLACKYKPHFDPRPAKFIWVEEDLHNRAKWQAFEQNAPLTIIPGSHLACVTDHVSLLAEHLKTFVKQSQEEKTSILESQLSTP